MLFVWLEKNPWQGFEVHLLLLSMLIGVLSCCV
jgi:hypothetical protein